MNRPFACLCVLLATFTYTGCGPKEPEVVPPTKPVEAPDPEPQATAPEPPATPAEESEPKSTDAKTPAEVAPVQTDAEPAPPAAEAVAGEPVPHTAFYRLADGPAEIPPVLLTKEHEALNKVKVGDAMPAIALPELASGQARKLSELFGKKATVVVFWNSGTRMAREQLADVAEDIVKPFGNAGVSVIGIVTNEPKDKAQATLQAAKADFPQLLDADGKAFAQVGSQRLPRTYLLDPSGKILWFDIEYSHATRRELHQALRSLAGEPASAGGRNAPLP